MATSIVLLSISFLLLQVTILPSTSAYASATTTNNGESQETSEIIVHSTIVLGEEGQTIEIDFGVALPERDMVVKKGETIRVPVTIETRGSVEKVLSLSLMPYTFDSSEIAGELVLSLDRETVVLSEDNIAQGKARLNEYGWVITDAGFLTITASPTATNGTYEYTVEASWAGEPGGTGMGSGQLITVTVTD